MEKNMMKIRIAVIGLACAVLAVADVRGDDFLIDDGDAVNIIQNANYGADSIILGIDNSGNGLRINNSVGLSAYSLYVGYTVDSTNNWVQLRADSALSLSQTLYVGFESSGNRLTTSDGALISIGGSGVIGFLDGSENNQVAVEGAGASWVMSNDLYVGFEGNDNNLQVNDGASLAVGRVLFVGDGSTADNNSMTVSNADVFVGYDVVVGYRGEGNQLRIMDDSTLDTLNGYVGATNLADNNMIFLSDGSTWKNYGGLYIGSVDNTGNMVTVTNGASIVTYDGLRIDGTGNAFNLERGGSLTVHTDFDASMEGFNFNEGSALYVGGILSGASSSIEGERTLGLIGTNAWWNQTGSNVTVGGATSDNMLHVSDGGRVDAGAVIVGSGNSTTGNTVTVSDNAALNIAGSLSIGTDSNANNLVEVSSGGVLRMGGDLILGGAGNTFNLGDGGWLVASNGLDASQSGFNFLAGGTVESLGTLSGIDASIEDLRAVLLNGSNAVWNTGTNVLYVGGSSSSNELHVLDGAYLSSADAMIGNSGTTGSFVYVSGPGSLWENAGHLSLDGYYNDLIIDQEGSVAVGKTLTVQNQAALIFASGGYASASNYYQDASSVFAFESVTNSPVSPALLTVTDTAEFEGGATLQYTGTISGLERGVIFTNRLVAANTLVVNGVTNAAGADLDALNVSDLGSLLSIDLVSTNDYLLAIISRLRLADSAGFEDGTDMAAVSDEIDFLADSGNALAENMINTLSQLDSSGQNATMSQLYDRHAPTYAHTKGLLDGFRQVQARGIVPSPMLPTGAMGPHLYRSQLQGWAKGYGSWGQRDATDAYSDYDQSTYGALLGMDKSYGEVLYGLAGGMAITDISQDDGDSSKGTTGYGIFYASVGTVSWFGDLNLGYGHSKIEDQSGTLFNTSAEYDADQLGFYLGGGKEMVFQDDRLFITPSAAMSGAYYVQGGYTERSSTAVPRRVDDYDYLSYRSELGLKTVYTYELKRSVFMPEVHVNWLHEFNADEERINYSLVGGTGQYSFGMVAPVEDLYEVGAVLSWWKSKARTDKLHEWALGLDGRFGDGYTETTASVRFFSRF